MTTSPAAAVALTDIERTCTQHRRAVYRIGCTSFTFREASCLNVSNCKLIIVHEQNFDEEKR